LHEVENQNEAFNNKKGARVLVVDDLIATGGTAGAVVNLVEKVEALCVECCP